MGNNPFMQEAIKEALEGIHNEHGGPFGAVIVKDNKIIGRGHNKVLKNNDPTAHGEVEAVRDACNNIKGYDLSDCDIYTTAAPCPMCKAALMWANVRNVYYGCTVKDTDDIGFRDEHFYNNFNNDEHMFEVDRDACKEVFNTYVELNPTIY